jgi:GNAT superfamily N-acetyltransferase
VDVVFRDFRRADLDPLYFLARRCSGGSGRFAYHRLLSALLAEGAGALVIDCADAGHAGLAGALLVRNESAARRLEISALMVAEDFRRMGLGRRLLAWAERVARGNGAAELVVPLEAECPQGAAFLAAHGFEDTGIAAPHFPDPGSGTLWCRKLTEEGSE